MPSKRTEKLMRARAQKKAAKAAGLANPGGESKYAKRHAARLRGVQMADRYVMPWWHEICSRALLAMKASGSYGHLERGAL